MDGIRRNFSVLLLLGVIVAIGVGTAYKLLAKGGYLGERQYDKYVAQTSRGTGVMSILMSGRSGFFAAFYAALDKPIIGHGSWALDYNGYYMRFLQKYGSHEELELYYASKVGRGEAYDYLPGHSQLMVGWTWHGIFGLIFWLYVLWLYWTTLSKRMSVVPQWFGYFCLALPSGMWNLLFSPLSRFPTSVLFVLCMFVKAVSERRMNLPPAMVREIREKAM